jgi:hypothetical protein
VENNYLMLIDRNHFVESYFDLNLEILYLIELVSQKSAPLHLLVLIVLSVAVLGIKMI